jgi:hypothetical protein
MQVRLKYKLLDVRKIKINADIKQDHPHLQGNKMKYLYYGLLKALLYLQLKQVNLIIIIKQLLILLKLIKAL